MSKGNIFLGQARGKVGDVVFYRTAGEQVTRARNRSPRNPRSPMQVANRVIMNTVSKAYSLLQELADHAFEGLNQGSQNQQQFIKDNTDMLRVRCAALFADPEDWRYYADLVYNFNPKPYTFPVINDYFISRGTLASLVVETFNPKAYLSLIGIDEIANPTYQDICDALGLQRGDQLTFVVTTHDGRLGYDIGSQMNGLRYGRVILEPSNGDMTTVFLDGTAINSPNAKNEGDVSFAIESKTWSDGSTHKGLGFTFSGVDESAYAQLTYGTAAVIASRWDGSKWLRSTQQLVPSWSGRYELNEDKMLQAIDSYMTESGSALYLNQGGASRQSSASEASISSIVIGSTTVNAGAQLTGVSLTASIIVTGNNLTAEYCNVKTSGGTEEDWDYESSTMLQMSNPGADGGTYIIYVDGEEYARWTNESVRP